MSAGASLHGATKASDMAAAVAAAKVADAVVFVIGGDWTTEHEGMDRYLSSAHSQLVFSARFKRKELRMSCDITVIQDKHIVAGRPSGAGAAGSTGSWARDACDCSYGPWCVKSA
eukprot:COSAG02_NODE_594_length_19849_cov_323.373114_4_plen_115_part_00